MACEGARQNDFLAAIEDRDIEAADACAELRDDAATEGYPIDHVARAGFEDRAGAERHARQDRPGEDFHRPAAQHHPPTCDAARGAYLHAAVADYAAAVEGAAQHP